VKIAAEQAKKSAYNPRWSEQYSKFQKLKDGYLRAKITEQNPDKLSDERLSELQEHDTECLWQLLEYSAGINKHWNWPDLLKDKALLDKVIDARIELFGNRLSGTWPDDFITPSGEIDWDGGGSFRKHCTDAANPERVVMMKHCSGASEHKIDSLTILLNSTKTKSNWSDMKANTVQGGYKPTWCTEGEFGQSLKSLRSQMNIAAISQFAIIVQKKLKSDSEAAQQAIAHHNVETDTSAVKKPRTRGPPTAEPMKLMITTPIKSEQ
jgi:hypothetical protein